MGESPDAGVVRDTAGNLYGTTQYGGVSNFGTVFKLDSIGNETVLYNFAGTPDGARPWRFQLRPRRSCGIVFRVDVKGNETVLHRFTGAKWEPSGRRRDSGYSGQSLRDNIPGRRFRLRHCFQDRTMSGPPPGFCLRPHHTLVTSTTVENYSILIVIPITRAGDGPPAGIE
jgi:uncharacterized repeat protein (TIGR03803 family)